MDTNDMDLFIIKNAIVGKLSPLKIYLFGSYAKNTNTKYSDYDLCIIVDDKTKRKVDLSIEAELSLVNVTNMATDIIVIYEDEFLERSNYIGTLEYIVANEGELIYERESSS